MRHEDRIKTFPDTQDLENFSCWPFSQKVSGAWRRKPWKGTHGIQETGDPAQERCKRKCHCHSCPAVPERSQSQTEQKNRNCKVGECLQGKKKNLKIDWQITWCVWISWKEISVSVRDFVDELVINTQKTKCSQFVEQMGTLGCRKKRSLFLDAKFILCIFKLFFPHILEWSLGQVSWLF